MKKIYVAVMMIGCLGGGLHAMDQGAAAAAAGSGVASGAETLEQFLCRGGHPDTKDFYGFTLLMGAAKQGSYDRVRLILERRGQPNLKDLSSRTAILLALIEKRVDIVALLLRYGANTPNTLDLGPDCLNCLHEAMALNKQMKTIA